MVRKETKTPPIGAIFDKIEKNKSGFPTENALLYQDILHYPLKTGDKRFKLRRLGTWLLTNHRDWKEYYDDPTSTYKNIPYRIRYENRKDRISAKVQHLLQMGLLSSDTTRAEKVDMEIPLFELTGEGFFISKMLERQDPSKKAKSNEELYNLIQNTFSNYGDGSSSILFLSKLYAKLKDKGLLDYILDVQREILENCKSISFPEGLFELNVFFTAFRSSVTDEAFRRAFEAFLEAMDSLDWFVKDNLRFILKSGYEQQIISQHPSRAWEYLWIEKMNDSSKLVTTATCPRCGSYPIAIDIPEQMYLVFRSFGKNTKCIKCNNNTATISSRSDRPFNREELKVRLARTTEKEAALDSLIVEPEE